MIQNSIQPLCGFSHSVIYISEGSVSISTVMLVAYSELFWLMTALLYSQLCLTVCGKIFETPILSSASTISQGVTTALAVAEVEAPQVEWAPNIDVSIPASSRIVFSHLALELEVTALCGLIKDTKSLVSSPLKPLVLSKYACSVATGQRGAFSGREGKKNS